MTQEEAVIKVLLELGGRATLKQLYEIVPKYAHFGTKTPDASIRSIIYKNKDIIPANDNDGWVEHISYKDITINHLKSEIANKDKVIQTLKEENERLKNELEEETNNNKASVKTAWMIKYAKKNPNNEERAEGIKEMLNYYYLYSDEASHEENFNMLQEINKISEEYAKNHPKQPLIKTADQVVVNNHGNVNHDNLNDNGQNRI